MDKDPTANTNKHHTRELDVKWVRTRYGQMVPVSYEDGIWYIGSDAGQLCSRCNVIWFDNEEFLTCPGCDLLVE